MDEGTSAASVLQKGYDCAGLFSKFLCSPLGGVGVRPLNPRPVQSQKYLQPCNVRQICTCVVIMDYKTLAPSVVQKKCAGAGLFNRSLNSPLDGVGGPTPQRTSCAQQKALRGGIPSPVLEPFPRS